MSFWFRSPTIGSDEAVVWDGAANREQAGWRAVDGRLTLTTTRLLFIANRFDAVLGGRDWEADRNGVQSVDVSDRSMRGGPFSGGIRRRLRLALSDGSGELFVVRRPDETAAELSRILAAR